MAIGLGGGGDLEIALADGLAPPFQFNPDLRMLPRFREREWQDRVILKHSFDKLKSARFNPGINRPGAAVQKF